MSEQTSAASLLGTAVEKVKSMVDVSTIIGDPVYTEAGLTIIPVSKVTYGFATGGTDLPTKGNKELFGGGGGAGITVTPIAFLLIQNGEVTIKHITTYDNAAERMVSLVPDMFDKVTGLVDKAKEDFKNN